MNTTTNYDLFKMIEGNRNLSRHHIEELKKSINEVGYMNTCPIIVNKDKEIIDGQHRFMACKEMGLPIQYIISEQEDIEDELIRFNTLQKKWSTEDYIKYFAIKKKKPDYIRLYSFMLDHKLPAISAVILCKGVDVGGEVSKKARAGVLTMTSAEIQQGAVRLDLTRSVMEALATTRLTDKMIKALVTLEKSPIFSWTTLIERVRKYRVKAYYCTTKDEWIEMLLNLYNYNVKSRRNLLKID